MLRTAQFVSRFAVLRIHIFRITGLLGYMMGSEGCEARERDVLSHVPIIYLMFALRMDLHRSENNIDFFLFCVWQAGRVHEL